jgi:hypothetical protein
VDKIYFYFPPPPRYNINCDLWCAKIKRYSHTYCQNMTTNSLCVVWFNGRFAMRYNKKLASSFWTIAKMNRRTIFVHRHLHTSQFYESRFQPERFRTNFYPRTYDSYVFTNISDAFEVTVAQILNLKHADTCMHTGDCMIQGPFTRNMMSNCVSCGASEFVLHNFLFRAVRIFFCVC